MEQLLQLERLKKTTLANVRILAISPDPPEKTRGLIAKVASGKGVSLTHTFLSDPSLGSADAYRIRNEKATSPLPHPTTVLVGKAGNEVWRFTEVDYKKRPSDAEIAAAMGLLN